MEKDGNNSVVFAISIPMRERRTMRRPSLPGASSSDGVKGSHQDLFSIYRIHYNLQIFGYKELLQDHILAQHVVLVHLEWIIVVDPLDAGLSMATPRVKTGRMDSGQSTMIANS